MMMISALSLGSAQVSGSYNVLVMGDWGGSASAPYSTSEEVSTAAAMEKTASEIPMAFAMALGDNFYSKGVTSEYDPRFEGTFESVFTGAHLQGDDFFRVLVGNHDHYGNVTAQVQYSNHSKRWRFDDLWYSFTETVDGNSSANSGASQTLEVVMMDTCLLCGFDHIEDPLTGEMHSPTGDMLPTPQEGTPERLVADTQLEWLNKTLMGSTADYLILAGHYPVYSICEHGPTPCLISDVKPIIDAAGVSMVLAGHDHCQEYLQVGATQYHGMGSAHVNDASVAHQKTVPSGSLKWHTPGTNGGYGVLSIGADGLTATHWSGKGEKLFTAPAVKPRSF
jgi:tartrate-resistant acid phosphatase type 5